MTISVDDVRRLLSAGDPKATLVLLEGRAEILSPDQLDTPDYRGALRVAAAEEIIKRTGSADPSDRELTEAAENLGAAVRNLGG
jgi:hypothetical protein